MAHETCLSSCPSPEDGLTFYPSSGSPKTGDTIPFKQSVTSCPFEWFDPDRQRHLAAVSINQYQSGRQCEESIITAHTSLLLPCGQLVVDTHSKDADSPLSLVASSDTTTDESEHSPCSSSSSETSSPHWQPLSPVSLPDVFDEYQRIECVISDPNQLEENNGSYPPTSDSIVGLDLGEYHSECTGLQDPFADPDPESYWRETVRQGLARQDCSSEWTWMPAPEFAYFVPSIVVTPPSDEDFDARMDVKTPIQDCLFGHRLFVPHCDQVFNLLPTMTPRGLGLDVYKEHLPFTQLPSIDDQVEQGIYAQVYVLPGSNRTGCSSKCAECWPQVEEEVVQEKETVAGPIDLKVEEQAVSKTTPDVCTPEADRRWQSMSQSDNPFWLEEDDEDLPDLDGW